MTARKTLHGLRRDVAPLPARADPITLAHGGGGQLTDELIAACVLPRLGNAVLDSVAATADEAGVRVVTGDTKVVGRGQADGMYVVTAGVGLLRADTCGASRPHPDRVRPGDQILLSGTIADHGLAVMLAREMPHVRSALRSDAAPLGRMIARLLARVPAGGVRFMRDPTRGGLAGAAADLAARTGLRVMLDEAAIPIRPETRHAAELLGIDPLDVANEGKVLAVVDPDYAEAALVALRDDPLGRDAALIGRVEAGADNVCELLTEMGGRRVLQKPYGEQLPRIC
jgi:hydrogenase expression/formation protein HypE